MMLTHRQHCRWFVDRSPCDCEAQARHELNLPTDGRLKVAEQDRVNDYWRAEHRQPTSAVAVAPPVSPALSASKATSQPTPSSVIGANVNTKKIEKHRAKLGMSATSSAEEVQTAWRADKEQKRDATARALGLPAGTDKAQIQAALEQLAQSANISVESARELVGVHRADQLPKVKATS